MNPRALPKDSHRMALFHAVTQGLEAPDPGRHRPRRPPPTGPVENGNPHTKVVVDRLRQERTEWATGLGMDPGFLVPTALLEKIARRSPTNLAQLREVPGISEWRCQALGDRILSVTAVMDPAKRC
jgi:ribonuclease D